MISGEYKIRPRYDEVDQMGYVYHGNYVSYCHQARTELLRNFGVNDKVLEDNGIMMPVIEMNLKYLKPSGYDNELTIRTCIKKLPTTRFYIEFVFENDKGEKVCKADSTVVFVDKDSRKPQRTPELIINALQAEFEMVS
ncbi:MAG: acyl-CoA thioesterase [Labilibaculum sp.]|nr:acyl-CoA thioesterase [Labilibaculum sp.]MBI9059384.1 acyl-CoA thioesterase [Labilibaculum sp.]